MEGVTLVRWSHGMKKDTKSTRDLFSFDNFLLHVHRCLQQESVIICINPRSEHNLINVDLAKRLEVLAKHIESIEVEGKNVQFLNV
jgi:hypothetical protein